LEVSFCILPLFFLLKGLDHGVSFFASQVSTVEGFFLNEAPRKIEASTKVFN